MSESLAIETAITVEELRKLILALATTLENRTEFLRSITCHIETLSGGDIAKAIHEGEGLGATRVMVIKSLINRKLEEIQRLESASFGEDTGAISLQAIDYQSIEKVVSRCPVCDGPTFQGTGVASGMEFCTGCYCRTASCTCHDRVTAVVPEAKKTRRPKPNLREEE